MPIKPPPQGCGKTFVPLTLFFVALNRDPRSMAGTLEKLPCGHLVECECPPGDECYGIVLCETCAIRAGFLRVN